MKVLLIIIVVSAVLFIWGLWGERLPGTQNKIEPEHPWPAPPVHRGVPVDCDEYCLHDGRCYHDGLDDICPREPQCHDEDRGWEDG